ncbi:hypothetical protein NL108_001209, partial [Boleophthalmus pectinirostris]
LPEQYYSLTWFLSPVLGLFFTPVIGSTSDRCTLRWGRRRPFILALCVGVLLGVALFLNGALIGLSVGDTAGSQPIGIALTVVGVIVLDFSADAADGPIRAYLLDVADTEEQDMALNIHAFSAGLGGAVGYMLGGLDWTGTALGQAFKAQEQVLFLFTAVVFIVSVILHMFSIPEKPYSPRQPGVSQNPDSTSQSSLKTVDHTAPMLDVIMEEDSSSDDSSDSDKEDMDLLGMERVRSKSDSVLAMPDATIEMDPDLHPDNQHFLAEVDLLPEVHEDLEDVFSPTEGNSDISLLHVPITCNNDSMNGSACNQHFQTVPTESKSLPSFTFSYYGRVGSQRYRLKRNTAAPLSPKRITSSRSLSDLSELQKEVQERERKFSMSSLSSEESSTVSEDEEETTLRLLWLSMLKMPTQLWRLCICHLLTWFAYIAQAVFFTDFMGQVIFQGDPIAPANSTEQQNYLSGVQMGCWGLVVYAATSAICSAILQKYLDHFDLSVKIIYIVGTLSFSVGTAVMAIFPNVYVAMVMISSMGVISMSISYCPYALLGQYHEIKEVSTKMHSYVHQWHVLFTNYVVCLFFQYIYHSPANTRRGFGIDCAILSCQ